MESESRNDLSLQFFDVDLGRVNYGFAKEDSNLSNMSDVPCGSTPPALSKQKKHRPVSNGSSHIRSTSSSPPTKRASPNPPTRPTKPRPMTQKGTETQREKWDNQVEFLLSCVSMSVGLGNVWRFPFTAYENGGGAFLIPYLIVLTLLGRPIYYLEMCLGQFTSFGPVKVWEVIPFFRGVGYASMFGVFCTCSFYCSIMAVTVHYFLASFSKVLPWSEETCNNAETRMDICDEYGKVNGSFSELYYFNTVFPQLPDIENGIGSPHWKLALCLLVSWISVFICIIKGIKSAGKASYFTALFPYVVLIILLVRGITLPGAANGIWYFIRPQWDKILDPKVWFAAVSQCFFSLNIGFGTIIFLSSHNDFRHNVFRDAVVISVTDTLTSCLAGCTIFAMLGYLAQSLNVDISTVSRGGPGLAFVAFPESISHLNWFPQGFAVLFFLMLFTLGIGSLLALVGQLITIIRDQFPSWRKWKVGLTVCTLGFLSGIVFITPGGQFILTLVNHNGADFIIYITATIEVIAISWVYGVNKLSDDLKFMLGRNTQLYWKVCWAIIMPIGLFSLLLYYFIRYDGLTHEGIPFPTVALVCGWVLSGLILSPLPICAIRAVIRSPGGTIMQKMKASLKSKESWGPKDPSERADWLKMIEMREAKLKADIQTVTVINSPQY